MLDDLTLKRMMLEAGEGPILVALSGGGDSVALLHLLAQRLGAARLRAAVVDHALRRGSADDAARARAFAEAAGVAADVLTLAWDESDNRAQQAARQARYAALCEHARAAGARVVAVAHTADDQAETVLMRAAAGSSWRGLAGMAPLAPAPLWPEGRDVLLARPLLQARRTGLREQLRARGAEWIEDPANANPAYERVRIRSKLAELAHAGLDLMRFVELTHRLRPRIEALNGEASKLIAAAAWFEDHRIRVRRAGWKGGDQARRRALSVLVAAAAGAAREPPPDALARLEAESRQDSFCGASLGGAQISRIGDDIVLERDRGAVEGRADGVVGLAPTTLRPGVETVWDGRLAVTSRADGVTLHAGTPAPQFTTAGGDAASLVTLRWLLAQRAAHALGSLWD